MICFLQAVLFPPSTETNKAKKPIFRYIKFLSMPQCSIQCSCHSPKVWGRRVSCWEQPGSLQHPHSTTTTTPGPPKSFRGKATRQQPRTLEINGKISTDFRQVSVPSGHFCRRHSHYWFHLFQQLIKHCSTNPHPTTTSCPAWHHRVEWSTLGIRKNLLAAWDGGIHTEVAPTYLHETRSGYNKDNSILL